MVDAARLAEELEGSGGFALFDHVDVMHILDVVERLRKFSLVPARVLQVGHGLLYIRPREGASGGSL